MRINILNYILEKKICNTCFCLLLFRYTMIFVFLLIIDFDLIIVNVLEIFSKKTIDN